MTDTTSTFPALPPPPDDQGEFLTWFNADIPSSSIDAAGCLVLRIKVHPEHKYMAMPLTDIIGRRFLVTVHTPRGRRPLVAADRTLAINDAHARRANRAAARKWAEVSAWFTGSDDDD